VRVSSVLRSQSTYPFVRLDEARKRVEARGVDVIDLGMGDPREPTDSRIQQALIDALPLTGGYPRATGLPELRQAIAGWTSRRFGASLDPDRQIVPTLGAKEAIFSFAQLVVDESAGKDTVVVTEPGYPVQERGARFARARVLALPLREENDFLPDLDALDAATWRRVAVLWVNYPNNPTCATAPRSLYDRLSELAAEYELVAASDEAYTELWYDEPPPSALELPDLTGVVAFHSLSKRSSMTGYRSGFVAGDAEICDALRAFRPTVGTAPQEFVQRASIAAWADEEHVERNRVLYGRKRAVLLEALRRAGLRVAGSAATMYLWVAVPEGHTSESYAERLLDAGLLVAPGSYLGPSGEGYIRFALVPTEERCAEAARRLEELA
jgi:succinyldiaminopimelate transaminase